MVCERIRLGIENQDRAYVLREKAGPGIIYQNERLFNYTHITFQTFISITGVCLIRADNNDF